MNFAPWLAIPSANLQRAAATVKAWRAMGYKVALLLDGPLKDAEIDADFVLRMDEYDGWGNSANLLSLTIIEQFNDIYWIVGGGDDMTPDPNLRGDQIASQCYRHFRGTMGVMQPTGDRQGQVVDGLVQSERICGSPWMGREFIERWNGGKGPIWPGYYHMWADTEMREVTLAAGLLWQRPDLTQHHDHWSFKKGGKHPAYMEQAAARAPDDRRLFAKRQAAGFPGHEPGEVAVRA